MYGVRENSVGRKPSGNGDNLGALTCTGFEYSAMILNTQSLSFKTSLALLRASFLELLNRCRGCAPKNVKIVYLKPFTFASVYFQPLEPPNLKHNIYLEKGSIFPNVPLAVPLLCFFGAKEKGSHCWKPFRYW